MQHSLPLIQVVVPLGLCFIMFGLGLGLHVRDFLKVCLAPKAVFLGFLAQVVLFPLCAFVIAKVFAFPFEIAMGGLLLSACPGGATSNLFTKLASGDVALSVCLTALSSLITTLTLPLIVSVGLKYYRAKSSLDIDIHTSALSVKLILLTWLPMGLGMGISRLAPRLSEKLEKPVRFISLGFLFLLIGGVLYKERLLLGEIIKSTGLYALLLNLVAVLLGYGLGRLGNLPFFQRITLALEVGVQNAALAILIASSPSMLNTPSLSVTPAIYSLFMYGFAFVLVAVSKKSGTPIKGMPLVNKICF